MDGNGRAKTITATLLLALTGAAGVGAGGLFGGCDQKDDIPVEAIEANRRAQEAERQRLAAAASRPAAPTTQQLLTGPKTDLRLGGMPLVLEVPKGWSLQSLGEGAVATVTGPASSGEVNVQFSSQPNTVSAAGVDSIVAKARQETQAKPHAVNRVEIRPLGPARVLEQRMISSVDFRGGALPPPVWEEIELPDGKKARIQANPPMLKWQFTVFTPTAEKDKFAVRTLAFMSLKLSEYEQDKEFLEQLVKSLRYEE